ncbi:hypothetical protein [Ulvibacterium sp.]|uniref:hypothetical protein n=1 Tax=Ulvibacterium sp. TaxID=2665914 RepID=UPI002621279B|nr:hypothetical protein [Ulvibacterium sp.]
MKNNSFTGLCAVCHEVIETQHVFSENNQVYLKKGNTSHSITLKNHEQWFPVNFQWIPVMELKNNLENQLEKLSK